MPDWFYSSCYFLAKIFVLFLSHGPFFIILVSSAKALKLWQLFLSLFITRPIQELQRKISSSSWDITSPRLCCQWKKKISGSILDIFPILFVSAVRRLFNINAHMSNCKTPTGFHFYGVLGVIFTFMSYFCFCLLIVFTWSKLGPPWTHTVHISKSSVK